MKHLFPIALAAALMAGAAQAQAPAPAAPIVIPPALPYGANITLEQARIVADATNADAAKRKLQVTFAVIDASGNLVYYQHATNGAHNAEAFAMKKALSALSNRRPSNIDAQRLAQGNPTIPYVPDLFPFPGGFPIVVDGKIIGAIGLTGGADDDVAKAGASALH